MNSGRPVLYVLIAINVIVHLVWLEWARVSEVGYAFMAENFLVSYDALAAGRFWTLLTSEFSHTDTTHLIFNMFALWTFGFDLSKLLGGLRFLHLYVVGAVLASLGHVVYGLLSGSPSPALGASGAVMAISVVYAGVYPRRTLMMMGLLPLPAFAAVGLFIVLDVLGVVGVGSSQIAHAAHLGGAAYGLGYYFLRVRPYLEVEAN